MFNKVRHLQRYGLYLAVLLFCAQLASLLHAHDFEKHLDNTQCQLCLHASHLGHALGGQAPTVPAVRFTSIQIDSINHVCYQSVITTHYHSRAPPAHA